VTPDPIWTASAESDLLVVSSRREETREGSGVRLLEMFDSAPRLLRTMPEMAPLWSPPFRRLVLKNPRFGLFYTPENRGLVVHAVRDLRQDRAAILRQLQIPCDDPSND
jgi:hypothetical protein